MSKSKASRHVSIVRPDLEDLATSHVQARVIIGYCDDKGVPRNKDRFFIVEPRVGRQVSVGSSTQDRALLHPACRAWNYQQDGKTLAGDRSIRIRIQHLDVEDAYTVGCICFRAESDRSAPKPPGKSPYCKSADMVTASRWNGTTFADMPCEGRACPLRQTYFQESGGRQYRKVDAKTLFRLVGRIDEEGVPALLVSVVTGSDYNVTQFAGLLDSVSQQWADLCAAIGVDVPIPGYGLPIRLQVYESTGDNSRFPRVHYTLDCDIEELFQREVTRRQRMSSYGHQLAAIESQRLLAAPASFDVDDDALDAQEVLSPVMTPTVEASRPSHEPVIITTEPTVSTVASQPPQIVQASPFPPTLFERARKAQLSAKSFTAILQEACPSPDEVDTEAVGEVLRRCIERVREKPESLPNFTTLLAPFASNIHTTAPEFAEQLTQLGCPPAPAAVPQAEDDNPFTPVEPAAPTQPQTLEAAVAGLELAVATSSPSDRLAVWNKLRLEILQLSGKLGQRITQDQTSRIAAARPS